MSPHSTVMEEQSFPSTNGAVESISMSTEADGFVSSSSDDGSSAPDLVPDDGANGTTNGAVLDDQFPQSQYIKPTHSEDIHDLICVGFGPASLAIAIALHDTMEAGKMAESPKVLFLEKQSQFAWHAGMLLPGARMQISFIKDLASLRDPRSHFTFLNYLHKNDRLVQFTNLSTFLPARVEYEDYLRWCARHFNDVVRYQNEVVSITPAQGEGPLKIFTVTSRDNSTGALSTYRAKNVIVAVGGQASIPKPLPAKNPQVIHSSQYASLVPKILSDASRPYSVAVVGAGQSAAEIFNNVQNLYPNSKTYMVMRSEFLKPSDDSPLPSAYRQNLLEGARATNYGVVRLELIEHLYEVMYHQRRTLGVDEKKWPHRIMPGRRIVRVDETGDRLRMKVALLGPDEESTDGPLYEEEDLDVDLIICATGYQRRAHVDMLKDSWSLLPEAEPVQSGLQPTKERWLVEASNADQPLKSSTRVLEVGRDYGVRFTPGAVAPGSGVWLQGCCEATHGMWALITRSSKFFSVKSYTFIGI
ncbi:L-ornithine N(5)-monooxygenase [Naviculisporaceae sp. PSN 640]